MSTHIKLGLIGDNIASSRSPRLHCTAGRLTGLNVTYDLLIPAEMEMDFDATFAHARTAGFRGVNITYPYKETVTAKLTIPDPLVQAMGAVNTVVFEPTGPQGFNTDYSGFVSAYRNARGNTNPGVVCLIGTGGVGKAVGFGLIKLGAKVIRCVDLDLHKARTLADALAALGTKTQVETYDDAMAAAQGADGLINCTPLGMVGIGGTPLPACAMAGATWAFDAVYTPVDTEFLQDAKASGLTVITGYELFFGQGVDAWSIFTGAPLDTIMLRAALEEDEA